MKLKLKTQAYQTASIYSQTPTLRVSTIRPPFCSFQQHSKPADLNYACPWQLRTVSPVQPLYSCCRFYSITKAAIMTLPRFRVQQNVS